VRDKRQKSRWDLLTEGAGEARRAEQRESEARTAKSATESPAPPSQLMKGIVSGENMRRALKPNAYLESLGLPRLARCR
jgi:hypothetical protein